MGGKRRESIAERGRPYGLGKEIQIDRLHRRESFSRTIRSSEADLSMAS